jgi:hypothetical protein
MIIACPYFHEAKVRGEGSITFRTHLVLNAAHAAFPLGP